MLHHKKYELQKVPLMCFKNVLFEKPTITITEAQNNCLPPVLHFFLFSKSFILHIFSGFNLTDDIIHTLGFTQHSGEVSQAT